MYLKKVKLGGSYMFYNVQEKIIGRIPSNSNIKVKGSDNSLYFGILGSLNSGISQNDFEAITGIKMDRTDNAPIHMSWDGKPVKVEYNINNEGQIQMKIIYNGYKCGVSIFVNEYMANNHLQSFEEYGVYLDFKNKKIYCAKVIKFSSGKI